MMIDWERRVIIVGRETMTIESVPRFRPRHDETGIFTWHERASCQGSTIFAEVPYSLNAEEARLIRATCRECPVSAECLEEGIRQKVRSQIRGGKHFTESGRIKPITASGAPPLYPDE